MSESGLLSEKIDTYLLSLGFKGLGVGCILRSGVRFNYRRTKKKADEKMRMRERGALGDAHERDGLVHDLWAHEHGRLDV